MMSLESNTLERLQQWYASMCNGDREHTYGVFISNIDNPDWSLKVELKDTYLHDVEFKELKIQRTDENDRILCKVEKGNFQGYGGPFNLGELTGVFLNWAEDNAP